MAKSTSIDLSSDRLLDIAGSMMERHNYSGALKMLNKNAEENGNDEESFMLYAEIFDDMGLYEKSINGWFKYMDFVDSFGLSDCYEGLAVSFMNLGNEHFSAYYYNKLLFECEELDGEMREAILKEFLSNEENPLKFAYPPALADYSDVIKKGIERMKSGDYDGAVEVFDAVDEDNKVYTSARNYIAMCKIISERSDEAEQECLNILQKQPDNVQALTTLAAVKTETGKDEDAVSLANRLLDLNVTQPEDIYKIATVCCENKLHDRAYEMFCKLPEEYSYDLTALYFKAVSAYNCGKFAESFETFDELVTIYPEAVTARYYYNFAREMYANGNFTELSYFYRLPQEIREASLKVLAAYTRLNASQAKKLSGELDLSDCIKWCFDEREDRGGELQHLAALTAVKAGLDGIVRDLLLDAFITERLKMEVLGMLAERNKNDSFGVVLCNIYKKVTTAALNIGRAKRKIFVVAYARLVAHFSVVNDKHGAKFASAAEKIYRRLEAEDKLGSVTNLDVLSAVIYIKSGVREAGLTGNKIYSFFEVTKEQVAKLSENL